jgi:hypothetical protein
MENTQRQITNPVTDEDAERIESSVLDAILAAGLPEWTRRWHYMEYSEWSRQLAKTYTQKEIEKRLIKTRGELHRASASHLRAIDRTSSMSSQSQARAHGRNNVVVTAVERSALEDAFCVHLFYPENAKSEPTNTTEA